MWHLVAFPTGDGTSAASSRITCSKLRLVWHLQPQLHVCWCEVEAGISSRQLLSINLCTLEELLVLEEIHACTCIVERCIEAIEEGANDIGSLPAIGRTCSLGNQLVVERLCLDEGRSIVLELDVCAQLFLRNVVSALLLLKIIDPLHGLPDNFLERALGVIIDRRVVRQLHANQCQASVGVEWLILASFERIQHNVIEGSHEDPQGDLADCSDERASTAGPNIAFRIRRHLQHLADVLDPPKDRPLESQSDIVTCSYLVLVEGLVRAQVDGGDCLRKA
mmetsp:Transcript_12192/g.30700  ORF Transcript_12192/g.30700 Transcript_12192/m.30700 type:complete len:279 (+) Transcript_12192:167-1003(+)